MASGPRKVRSYICEEYGGRPLELHVPLLFSPVFQPRPAVTRIARAGGDPFPGWTAAGATEVLGGKSAERPGAHSVRRGAARLILEAGDSFPQLLRPG